MDWMLSTGGAPSMVLIPLGVYYNNQYQTNPHCSTYLEVLITQLNCDDKKTHWRRRGLGFVDIINTDLIPMLISCNDQPGIFRSTVKLLAGVTMPIECLTFEEIPDQRINSSFIIRELTVNLYRAKEAFLDSTATKVLIDFIKQREKNQPCSLEECECVSFSLLLLRNVLGVQERHSVQNQPISSSSPKCNSQQNQLVCILFSQEFDQLLLDMLASCPQRDEWMTTTAQIIAILFKNQSLGKIQNRLNALMSSATSESSDGDEESNISSNKINTCESGESMTFSLSSSTSSKRRAKCKRFISRKLKRQREAHRYLPTDDNILELLEQFVVEFMQNGFNTLVGNLYQQLLSHEDVQLDKAHFFWFIANFVGFFSILKLDVKHVKDVLNVDILSYLTSEAVRETEKWEERIRYSFEIKPRRLHLCIIAIREYLRVLEVNSSVGDGGLLGGSEESQGLEDWITQLCVHLSAMRDLQKLFLLLLRQFNNPKIQNQSFLSNIIIANHLLLLILKRTAVSGRRFDFKKHLQQFCSKIILTQYGSVLEDFRTNDTFLNDSILTFLRYLHDDLGRTDLLCEIVVIRPFIKIWEEKSKILDNWNDLIVCAIHNFTSNYQQSGCDDPRSIFKGNSSGSWDQEISQAMQFMSIYQFDDHEDQAANHIPKEDIHSVISQLISSGFHKQLKWIQSSLLTTCSAKLGTYDGKEFCKPVACLSVKQNIPCPIVPWTEREVYALRSERFFSLLHGLGLLASTPQAGFYPCIPREWSANILYDVALIFGPIDPQKLDFDLSLLTKAESEQTSPSPLFNQSEEKSMDGSLSHMWELDEETESSKFQPGVSNRVLQWVNQQSGIRLRSPERKNDDIAALDDRLTDVNEPFTVESATREEVSLDEEMSSALKKYRK